MSRKIPSGKIAGGIVRFIIGIPRWVLRIALILLVVPLVLGGLEQCHSVAEPPPSGQAPWVVQTYISTDNVTRIPAHFYLGKEYGVFDGVPVLKGYWEYDGNDYIYHEAIIEFPQSEYGAIDVLRRTQ